MTDNHASSGDDPRLISQPQFTPGPGELTFTNNWTGKAFRLKALHSRPGSGESLDMVHVVEVTGDLGAESKRYVTGSG